MCLKCQSYLTNVHLCHVIITDYRELEDMAFLGSLVVMLCENM